MGMANTRTLIIVIPVKRQKPITPALQLKKLRGCRFSSFYGPTTAGKYATRDVMSTAFMNFFAYATQSEAGHQRSKSGAKLLRNPETTLPGISASPNGLKSFDGNSKSLLLSLSCFLGDGDFHQTGSRL